MNIEDVHKENFRRIAVAGLHEGAVLIHCNTGNREKVLSIHPMYGWVLTDRQCLKQNMDNLCDYGIITHVKTVGSRQIITYKKGTFTEKWATLVTITT